MDFTDPQVKLDDGTLATYDRFSVRAKMDELVHGTALS